jgi:peptidoglycan/LPS O-acetylase OafA/YrhL
MSTTIDRMPVQPAASASAPVVATPKPRVVFLDVVRGLAALLVFFEHTAEEISHFSDKNWPYMFWSFRWFNFGRLGVAAFFLVSGFVIPYSLERAKSLRVFWVSRVFRLYPIFWFSILIVFAYHLAGNDAMMHDYLPHWRTTLLVNATMLEEFLGYHHAITVYWTLTLELVFYVIFSLMYVLGVNQRTLLFGWLSAGALLAAGAIEAATHRKLPVGHIALLALAFLGTAAFRFHGGLMTLRQLWLLTLGMVAGMALAFFFGFRGPYQTTDAYQEWSWFAMLGSYVAGMALFGVIFALRGRSFPFALRWLGAISYSFYLLHYPCWLALMWVPHHGLVSAPLWQSLVLALVTALSSITYLMIEKPMVELGKRMLGRPKPVTELGNPISVTTPAGPVSMIAKAS